MIHGSGIVDCGRFIYFSSVGETPLLGVLLLRVLLLRLILLPLSAFVRGGISFITILAITIE